MIDLKDKVAMVTGGSSGIGAAIVKELLQSGMKVVGLARRKAKIEEIPKTCSGCVGKLFALETDVSKEEDILRAFAWTQNNVGPVYVLVNVAGVCHSQPITEAKTDHLKQVLDTNLFGLSLFTREAIKCMQANKIDGTIVNISSIAGHAVPLLPGIAMYTASKFGVTAFTEAVRQELAQAGSKIRITSVSPGLVETDLAQGFLPQKPYLQPEDIASGVKFVLTQPANVNVAEIIIRPILELI